jgi:hypothetical protein
VGACEDVGGGGLSQREIARRLGSIGGRSRGCWRARSRGAADARLWARRSTRSSRCYDGCSPSGR